MKCAVLQAEVLDPVARLYALPATDAHVVATVKQGTMLELEPLPDPLEGWYVVHLPRGARAYLNRAVHVLLFRPITLAADTDVYAEPDYDAQVVYRYGKSALMLAFVDQPEEHNWLKVCDGQGEIWYLPPDIGIAETKILTPRQREYAKLMAKAKDRMLRGGALFIIGCGITYITYETAVSQSFGPGSHYYLFAWGPMLFGALRFLLGFGTWLLNVEGNGLEGENSAG